MKKYSSVDNGGPAYEQGQPQPPSPFDKRQPIKVSFTVYVVSLVFIALAIFILMLVQYLPGYRSNVQLAEAVDNADYVYVGVRIPKSELKERDINPLTKEDDLVKMFKDMGAKDVKVEINPDKTKIPGE